MQKSYSVFTTTNSGVEYPVKNLFGSRKSAKKWIQEHNLDEVQKPYYGPEGQITFLRYLNGLFVKPIDGQITIWSALTEEGKDVHAVSVFPWETKQDALNRINHTPYEKRKLVKIY